MRLVMLCVSCSSADPQGSSSLVSRLDAVILGVVARGNSPSIQAAVVRGGDIVWSHAFGENTSSKHVYMYASVQKVFAAIAVLQLVERGLVDLDADVSNYVPFVVRHPGQPETLITVGLLLAHRAGLDALPYQFAWDTGSARSPRYRPAAPNQLVTMSREECLIESLTPGGADYHPAAWVREPGRRYHYSVSTYPFLRYLAGQVTGQDYEACMRERAFRPLGMEHSGFSPTNFAGHHAIPYAHIEGENARLPMWDGQGSLIHTTADNMARLLLALMNDGRYGDYPLLHPDTIQLLQARTSRCRTLFRGSDDLQFTGHGLGLFVFRGGWFGYGGSAPGFQCLLRFHPSGHVGCVVLSNVNAILGSGHNFDAARRETCEVQDALASIVASSRIVRSRAAEVRLAAASLVYLVIVGLWVRQRGLLGKRRGSAGQESQWWVTWSTATSDRRPARTGDRPGPRLSLVRGSARKGSAHQFIGGHDAMASCWEAFALAGV